MSTNPHVCKRFKQTGTMKFMAANISITRNGKRTEQSISRDTVFLKCASCGTTQEVDRKRVVSKGSYLAIAKAEGDAAKGVKCDV